MATEVHKYRVWCNTDSKYVEVWAEEEPTTCPENNGHSIDPDKTVIVETVSEDFPLSDIDEKKIAVHPSYKPRVEGKTTYAVWTGAGDDLSQSPSGLGEGELLDFVMTEQTGSPLVKQVVQKKMQFDPVHGRVWLHEGYMSYSDGGAGDYLDSDIIAYATPLQTLANKIVYIEDNWVKYAVPGSPGQVATHGWGGTPVLIPRSYSKDGDWDYDGVNLTPNLAGTGGYKISDIERTVHRYINKIPCYGSSPFFSMTSDETTELPPGYYIRINVHNESNTNWHLQVFIEMYRERTYIP